MSSAALLDSMRTRLLTVGTLPAERRWQNVAGETPNPLPYVVDTLLSGRHEAAQLGPALGLTKASYLYQITLVFQDGIGIHDVLAVADAIATAFRSSELNVTGLNPAQVRSVSIGPFLPDPVEQTLRVPVSITVDWYF